MQEVGKDFILVKINTDHQPAIASKYGITALPTIIFFNSNGEVIHKFIGGRPYAAVMQEVNTAKSKL